MNTNWIGVWAQERQGFYASKVIKKADIPKYTRIVLRYNKFYKKDSNRPRFVLCFSDSEGYKERCIPLEIEEEHEEEQEERTYTYDEVQYAINRAVSDALSGYTDNLVEDYL